MAIITINTIPISKFITDFIEAVGTTGWIIILCCIFLLLICELIKTIMEGEKLKIKGKKIDEDFKKVKFFHKKFNEAKTKEDLNKLEEWRKKNSDSFYY